MFYEYEITQKRKPLLPRSYALSMAAFTNDNTSGRAAIINQIPLPISRKVGGVRKILTKKTFLP